MGKQRIYDHVGRIDILKERPAKKPNYDWVGGVAVLFIILLLLSQCS